MAYIYYDQKSNGVIYASLIICVIKSARYTRTMSYYRSLARR